MKKRGISLREFGRRDKCSHVLVMRAITAGHLVTYADGSLDPALVGSGWREGNRRNGNAAGNGATNGAAAAGVEIKAREGETQSAALRRIMSEGGEPYSRAEADRRSANLDLLRKQLQADIESERLVLVDDIERIVGADYRGVRNHLLAIPSGHAPRLHRCKTVEELRAMLEDVIRAALEELSEGKVLQRSRAAQPARRRNGQP